MCKHGLYVKECAIYIGNRYNAMDWKSFIFLHTLDRTLVDKMNGHAYFISAHK